MIHPLQMAYESIQKNVSMRQSAVSTTKWTVFHTVNKTINRLPLKLFFTILSPFKTYEAIPENE